MRLFGSESREGLGLDGVRETGLWSGKNAFEVATQPSAAPV